MGYEVDDFSLVNYGLSGPVSIGADGHGQRIWFHTDTKGARLRWSAKDGGALEMLGSNFVLNTLDGSVIVFKITHIEQMRITADGVEIVGTMDFGGAVSVDTINEHTAAAGVTIDGVQCKDGAIYF